VPERREDDPVRAPAARSADLPSVAVRSASPRAAAALAAGLWLALALFGARVHWVEEAGTAERDGYVAKAEELLAGSLPRDPFRPLLYPLATAGLAWLGLPPFAAARLLANLAAAGLVLVAWGLGRRLGGPRLAGWAAAATAVNPNLWILGQHTTTDMPFAALAGACLLAALAYLERPGLLPASAAGLAWGAAAFTRGNAVFLLPALLAGWGLAVWRPADSGPAPTRGSTAGERAPRRWRLGHLVAAAGAAVVVLTPHWLLRAAAFGSPLYDENWKNLAFKLYGFPDWSYLDRVPFDGVWAVLTADPARVLQGFAAQLGRFAAAGLAQLVGTPLHALVAVAGAVVAVRFRPRLAGWLLAAAGLFLAATAFAFFTWGRLLLVLLPVANVCAFAPFAEPGDGLRTRLAGRWGRALPALARRLPRLAFLAALGLVALLAVKTFAFRLPAFAGRHPYTEVAVLQDLDRRLPPGAALAGTSPFLGRYLEHPYLGVPDAFGEELARPELYFARLRPWLRGAGVRYLVAGELDLRDRPPSLLGAAPPVPWLARVEREGSVVVWEVRPGPTAGLTPGPAAPSAPRR
jgi:hypothetical protein